MTTVHFVIPTIPPRADLLVRAVASIDAQRINGSPISSDTHIEVDHDARGASPTRNVALRRALDHSDPWDWIAFLDDDDELLPNHCELLLSAAIEQGVGCAFGWFEVVGGSDPFPEHRWLPFDPEAPRVVPITYMAKASVLAEAVEVTGGFVEAQAHTGYWSQDQYLLCEVVRRGGCAVLTDISWRWFHDSGNTSGRPWRKR